MSKQRKPPTDELTDERLAEIEAAKLGLAVDEDALQAIEDLIAEVRRLRAERLTPEECTVIRRSLDAGLADELVGKDEFHKICAVRAKIEACKEASE